MVAKNPFMVPYPAPDVPLVPRTYAAGIYGYILICSLPVAAICWFIAVLRAVQTAHPSWLLQGLVLSVLFLFFALVFARSFKLEVRSDGVAYTNLFRRTRFVPYADISAVVLVNYQTYPTRRGEVRRWTLVVTPKVETGQRTLKVPLTLFQSDAYSDLVRLLHPAVWAP